MRNLHEIMGVIEQGWPFTEEQYHMLHPRNPHHVELTTNEKRDQASRHIILHLMKEVAKLGATYEKQDHSGMRVWSRDLEVIRDLLVCTFRYASLHGYTATDIEQVIIGWSQHHHGPEK